MNNNLDSKLQRPLESSPERLSKASLKALGNATPDQGTAQTAPRPALNRPATTQYLNQIAHEQDEVGEALARSINRVNQGLSQASYAPDDADAPVDAQSKSMAVYTKLAGKLIDRDQGLQNRVAHNLSESNHPIKAKDAAHSLQQAMERLPERLQEGTTSGKELAKFMVQNLVQLADTKNMGAGLERDLAMRQISVPQHQVSPRMQQANAKVLAASINYIKQNQPEVLDQLTKQPQPEPKPSAQSQQQQPTHQPAPQQAQSTISDAELEGKTYLDIFKQRSAQGVNQGIPFAPQGKGGAYDRMSAEISQRIHELITKAASNAKSGNLIRLSPEEAENFDRTVSAARERAQGEHGTRLQSMLDRATTDQQKAHAAQGPDGTLPPSTNTKATQAEAVRGLSLSELSARAAKLQQQFREERQRIVSEGKLPNPAQLPETKFDAPKAAASPPTPESQARQQALSNVENNTRQLMAALAQAKAALASKIAQGVPPDAIEQEGTIPTKPEVVATKAAEPSAKAPAQPSSEPKPAPETKPAEAKPTEAKPTEAKPTDAKSVEAKPVEAKPTEAKPTPAPAAESAKPLDLSLLKNTTLNVSYQAVQSTLYGDLDVMPGMTIPVSHFGDLQNEVITPNDKAIEILKAQARVLAAQQQAQASNNLTELVASTKTAAQPNQAQAAAQQILSQQSQQPAQPTPAQPAPQVVTSGPQQAAAQVAEQAQAAAQQLQAQQTPTQQAAQQPAQQPAQAAPQVVTSGPQQAAAQVAEQAQATAQQLQAQQTPTQQAAQQPAQQPAQAAPQVVTSGPQQAAAQVAEQAQAAAQQLQAQQTPAKQTPAQQPAQSAPQVVTSGPQQAAAQVAEQAKAAAQQLQAQQTTAQPASQQPAQSAPQVVTSGPQQAAAQVAEQAQAAAQQLQAQQLQTQQTPAQQPAQSAPQVVTSGPQQAAAQVAEQAQAAAQQLQAQQTPTQQASQQPAQQPAQSAPQVVTSGPQQAAAQVAAEAQAAAQQLQAQQTPAQQASQQPAQQPAQSAPQVVTSGPQQAAAQVAEQAQAAAQQLQAQQTPAQQTPAQQPALSAPQVVTSGPQQAAAQVAEQAQVAAQQLQAQQTPAQPASQQPAQSAPQVVTSGPQQAAAQVAEQAQAAAQQLQAQQTPAQQTPAQQPAQSAPQVVTSGPQQAAAQVAAEAQAAAQQLQAQQTPAQPASQQPAQSAPQVVTSGPQQAAAQVAEQAQVASQQLQAQQTPAQQASQQSAQQPAQSAPQVVTSGPQQAAAQVAAEAQAAAQQLQAQQTPAQQAAQQPAQSAPQVVTSGPQQAAAQVAAEAQAAAQQLQAQQTPAQQAAQQPAQSAPQVVTLGPQQAAAQVAAEAQAAAQQLQAQQTPAQQTSQQPAQSAPQVVTSGPQQAAAQVAEQAQAAAQQLQAQQTPAQPASQQSAQQPAQAAPQVVTSGPQQAAAQVAAEAQAAAQQLQAQQTPTQPAAQQPAQSAPQVVTSGPQQAAAQVAAEAQAAAQQLQAQQTPAQQASQSAPQVVTSGPQQAAAPVAEETRAAAPAPATSAEPVRSVGARYARLYGQMQTGNYDEAQIKHPTNDVLRDKAAAEQLRSDQSVVLSTLSKLEQIIAKRQHSELAARSPTQTVAEVSARLNAGTAAAPLYEGEAEPTKSPDPGLLHATRPTSAPQSEADPALNEESAKIAAATERARAQSLERSEPPAPTASHASVTDVKQTREFLAAQAQEQRIAQDQAQQKEQAQQAAAKLIVEQEQEQEQLERKAVAQALELEQVQAETEQALNQQQLAQEQAAVISAHTAQQANSAPVNSVTGAPSLLASQGSSILNPSAPNKVGTASDFNRLYREAMQSEAQQRTQHYADLDQTRQEQQVKAARDTVTLTQQRAAEAQALGSSQVNTVGDTNIRATGATIASATTNLTEPRLAQSATTQGATAQTVAPSPSAQGQAAPSTATSQGTASAQAMPSSAATTASALPAGATASAQAAPNVGSAPMPNAATNLTGTMPQGASPRADSAALGTASNVKVGALGGVSATAPTTDVSGMPASGVSGTAAASAAAPAAGTAQGNAASANLGAATTLGLDEESLQDEIIKNVMRTVPSDDLDEFNLRSGQPLSGVIADTDLTAEPSVSAMPQAPSSSFSALNPSPEAVVPRERTAGAAGVSVGQNAPIPEQSVVKSYEAPAEGGLLRRLASLFGRNSAPSAPAETPEIAQGQSASVVASTVDGLKRAASREDQPSTLRTNSLDQMVARLTQAAGDSSLPAPMQQQARKLMAALENPVSDLHTVSNWLNFVTGPLAPSSSQALALHQWAFMLLCIRFEQIGRNVDKFLKQQGKVAAGNEPDLLEELEPALREAKDVAKSLRSSKGDSSARISSQLLDDTMGQIERLQHNMQLTAPDQVLPRAIPLPPFYRGGKEGSLSARRETEDDGSKSWHLDFNFDLENLGPLEVKVKMHFPDVQMSFIVERLETLQKVQSLMPELNQHLAQMGLHAKGSNARLGHITPPVTTSPDLGSHSGFRYEGSSFTTNA